MNDLIKCLRIIKNIFMAWDKQPSKLTIFTKEEFDILSKYKTGAILASEDKDMAYDLALSGCMNLGFHENIDGTLSETASTIDWGMKFVGLKHISESKLKSLYFRTLTYFGAGYQSRERAHFLFYSIILFCFNQKSLLN